MKESLFSFVIIFVLFFGVGTKAFAVVVPPQSLSVSATVVSVPGGNAGGGGGGGYIMPTSVVFSGSAYSFSKVYLLKDGQLIATTLVDSASKFSITENKSLNSGNYLFSLFGEDSLMRRSKMFNISLHLTRGTTTTVSGIFLLRNIEPEEINPICNLIGDLNNDCRVNLVDFSIMTYWRKKENPPKKIDLNKDKKINIVDFSILAYYWTG